VKSLTLVVQNVCFTEGFETVDLKDVKALDELNC
jgi:hypothetical protein